MQYMTEQEIDNIASETMKALAKEKRVVITIQPDSGEAYWEGGINGHFFRIKTNTPVAVPESLARQISLSNSVLAASEKATRAYRREGGRKMS